MLRSRDDLPARYSSPSPSPPPQQSVPKPRRSTQLSVSSSRRRSSALPLPQLALLDDSSSDPTTFSIKGTTPALEVTLDVVDQSVTKRTVASSDKFKPVHRSAASAPSKTTDLNNRRKSPAETIEAEADEEEVSKPTSRSRRRTATKDAVQAAVTPSQPCIETTEKESDRRRSTTPASEPDIDSQVMEVDSQPVAELEAEGYEREALAEQPNGIHVTSRGSRGQRGMAVEGLEGVKNVKATRRKVVELSSLSEGKQWQFSSKEFQLRECLGCRRESTCWTRK